MGRYLVFLALQGDYSVVCSQKDWATGVQGGNLLISAFFITFPSFPVSIHHPSLVLVKIISHVNYLHSGSCPRVWLSGPQFRWACMRYGYKDISWTFKHGGQQRDSLSNKPRAKQIHWDTGSLSTCPSNSAIAQTFLELLFLNCLQCPQNTRFRWPEIPMPVH